MLIWTSLFINIILTIILCCFMPTATAAFLWGPAIYFGLSALSFTAIILLSMRLGKSGPRDIREIRRYTVHEYNDIAYYIEDGNEIYGPLPLSDVDNTVFVRGLEKPYVESHRYGITGWRRRWLWDLYDDTYIITLYLPSKDED